MIKTEGNVEINSYGIATCKENCSISFHPEKGKLFNSSFSFLVCQLSSDANINFGISDNSISFDYFSFLCNIRKEKISPQIQIDGVGILINIYVSIQGNILIYVNGELISNDSIIRSLDSYFYLNVENSNSKPTIIVTPVKISDVETENNKSVDEKKKFFYSKLDVKYFNRFFPYYEPNFWNHGQQTAYICDFTVGSITSYSQYNLIISQKSLLPLPCPDLKFYFEINITNFYKQNDSIDISFGLTRHNILENQSQQQSHSLPLHSFVFYNYINDLIKHGTNRNNININSKFDECPVTLGFGVTADQIYFTVNGEISCTINMNKKMNDTEINSLQLYPFIMIPSAGVEIEFNFGQLPFKYSGDLIKLPLGWSIYYPFYENKFKIGGSPHRHLLNTFLSYGFQMETAVQLQLKNELVGDEVKYEVHFLHLENTELIGCGFGNKNLKPNQMVGWENECVGLHSDDGNLFFQTGAGTRRIVDSNSIKTGTTETVYLNGKNLTYYIDRNKKENVCVFPFEKYPTLTTKGGVEFVLNFGESPFFAFENDYEEDDAVILFNKLKVKLSNFLLPIFNLRVGDVIESRDRSFRGTIAGSSDDRIYVYITNYPGAFPLVETNCLDFEINYRIVYRESEPLFQRIVTSRLEPVVIDISQSMFDKVFPTQLGLAFLIGTSKINGCQLHIFRPVEDLINNLPVLVLSEKPRDIMIPAKARIFSLFKNFNDQNDQTFSFQLFDVIQYTRKDKKKVLLVVGTDEKEPNSILCFDGNQFLRLETNPQILTKKTLKFVLNPFGYRRERVKYEYAYQSTPIYIGMNRGGRHYPFDYRGVYGTCFETETEAMTLFPCDYLGSHIPPLLEFFLRKLNGFFSFLLSKESSSLNTKNIGTNQQLNSDWMYTTEEKSFKTKSNLVTDMEFSGNFILSENQE